MIKIFTIVLLMPLIACHPKLHKPKEIHELDSQKMGESNNSDAVKDISEIELTPTSEVTDYANDLLGLVANGVEAIVLFDTEGEPSAFYELEFTPSGSNQTEGLHLTDGENLSTVKINGVTYNLPSGFVSVKGYETRVGKKTQIGDTKMLGKGSQGTAFLVRHGPSNSLWALKFDNETIARNPKLSPDYLSTVAKTFLVDDWDVANSMKTGHGNEVSVSVLRTAPSLDGRSIGGIPVVIKTGITGGTLKEALELGHFNNSVEPRYKHMKTDLADLFVRMSKGGKVYADLNPDNIMWKFKDPDYPDLGGKWVVIDAKPPVEVSDFYQAWRGNIDSFLEKLPVKGRDFKSYRKRRWLFNRVGRGLYLPKLSETQFTAAKDFIESGEIYKTLLNAKLTHDNFPKSVDELTKVQKIVLTTSAADLKKLNLPSDQVTSILMNQKILKQFVVTEALKARTPDFLNAELTEAEKVFYRRISEADIRAIGLDSVELQKALNLKQDLTKKVLSHIAISSADVSDFHSLYHGFGWSHKKVLDLPEKEIKKILIGDEALQKILNLRKQLQKLKIRKFR